MNDRKNEKIENEYIDLLSQILIQKRDMIKNAGLSYGNIEIKRDYSNDKSYTSEVVLDFYSNDNLVEVIEFFIYYHNELKATLDETKDWILEVVDDIISIRA